jgi:hypothetical protein
LWFGVTNRFRVTHIAKKLRQLIECREPPKAGFHKKRLVGAGAEEGQEERRKPRLILTRIDSEFITEIFLVWLLAREDSVVFVQSPKTEEEPQFAGNAR